MHRMWQTNVRRFNRLLSLAFEFGRGELVWKLMNFGVNSLCEPY